MRRTVDSVSNRVWGDPLWGIGTVGNLVLGPLSGLLMLSGLVLFVWSLTIDGNTSATVLAVALVVAGWSLSEIDGRREKESTAERARELARTAELEYANWLNMIETGASTRVAGSALLAAVVRWEDLERVVAHLLTADHWLNVRQTRAGADGGIDVIGDSPPRRVAAQVKHVKTPVGRPVLQQLLGAAQAGGFTDAVLASSGGFAQTVRDLAREQQSSTHLQLWDRPEIIKKIDALDAAAFKAMVSPIIPHLAKK